MLFPHQRRVEHLFHVARPFLKPASPCLVVYHTYAFLPGISVRYLVETVYPPANLYGMPDVTGIESNIFKHVSLKAYYGKRSERLVYFEQTSYISYYHFPVYQLQTVVLHLPGGVVSRLEKLLSEGFVYARLYLFAVFKHAFYIRRLHQTVRLHYLFVYQLRCKVKDIAEYSVVYFITGVVRLFYSCHIIIIETQRAPPVIVHCRWRQIVYVHQPLHYLGCFLYALGGDDVAVFLRMQRPAFYRMPAFHNELHHETAHLPCLSVVCRAVVDNGYIACALQHPVKII